MRKAMRKTMRKILRKTLREPESGMSPSVLLLIVGSAVSLMALVAVPGVALAQGDGADPGYYVGGAFAIGIEQFDLEGNFSDHDDAFGFDVWAGYRANRYLAIEAEFVYLAGFNSAIGGNSVGFNALSFTANLKFYPLTGRFRPYLVGGVGGGRFETESGPSQGHDKGGVFRFGGGVELNFGTPVDLVAGADYLITSGLAGSDFLQIKIGFQRQF
ncbi:MAG: porin family protein [Myxococcales bacterium]|nr:porin family protein [Myxococcales bacterium]